MILIVVRKTVIINTITTACGYSSMVEHRLPKPVMRVRFSLPAPFFGAIAQLGERYLDMVEVSQVRSLFAPPFLPPVLGGVFIFQEDCLLRLQLCTTAPTGNKGEYPAKQTVP